MEYSVELKSVSKQFRKKKVLHDINLKIRKGEIYGLLGPSGCGKTTTVKIISGILSPTSGESYVLGNKMPALDIMGKIGYMAQAAALYETLTGLENLEFFGRIYGFSKNNLNARIEYVTALVGLSDEELSRLTATYSGGMKQRLSLAISLLPNPEVLILDEPTVGIDPLLRSKIWKELIKLSNDDVTIIITTHVMDEALKCDRLALIREGKMIAEGQPQELIKKSGKNSIEEAFIFYGGGCDEN